MTATNHALLDRTYAVADRLGAALVQTLDEAALYRAALRWAGATLERCASGEAHPTEAKMAAGQIRALLREGAK